MSTIGEVNYQELFVELTANVIDRNIDKFFKALGEKAKDTKEKMKVDLGTAYKQYLKKSFDKYSTIKTIIHNTQPMYLYDLFVCSNLTINQRPVDASNIENLINISRYLILRGSGGFGKSTMMKHFFLNAINNRKRIPVYIELKDISNCDIALVDYIYFSMRKLGFKIDRKYFEYALSGDSFVFLLDGYDEISGDKAETVFHEINDMCDQFSDNVYIISSRPIETFVSFQRFSIIDTQPLSISQAVELISKIDYDASTKARFLKELQDNLFRSHQSFASNPLLLNIMLLTYHNYAEIPSKRHIFYEYAYETLFSKHDATKGGYRRQMKTALAINQFKDIFSEFCFLQFLNGKVDFEIDEINRFFEKESIAKYGINVSDFIWDLEKAVCLIQKDGTKYKFIHRSFQEYFSACYIKDLDDNMLERVGGYLVSKQSKLHPVSVLDMLYDMIQARFEYRIIIPYLRKMEEYLSKISTEKDKFLFIYERFFGDISFEIIEKKEKHFSLSEKRYKLYVIIDGSYITDLIWHKYCHNKHKEKKYAAPVYYTYSELIAIAKTKKAPLENTSLSDSSSFLAVADNDNIFRFSISDIFSLDGVYNLVKKSFLKIDIDTISELRKLLEEQHNNSSYELELLLNIK